MIRLALVGQATRAYDGLSGKATTQRFEDFGYQTDAFGGAIITPQKGGGFEAAVVETTINPTLEKIAIAYALKPMEIDGVTFYASSYPPAPIDPTAESLLESVLAADPSQARAMIIGASYRIASFALAANDKRPFQRTFQGVAADIELIKTEGLATSFYEMQRLHYRHKRFDGGFSPVLQREMLATGDSVVVLPFDPIRKQLVMIEQMRPAALVRRSIDAWGLEAVAGVIDQGETPIETAHRETMEEAGLTVRALYPIPPSYQSGGALSQFMYPFIALVDLSDYQSGQFGLADENEDIRTHIVDLDEAFALLKSGEINNALLQLCLYALAMDLAEISALA